MDTNVLPTPSSGKTAPVRSGATPERTRPSGDLRARDLHDPGPDATAANTRPVPETTGIGGAGEDLIAASSGQRRLWFLDQMEPGTALYNIPYLIRLSGPLDRGALHRALSAIVERHEVLRTVFVASGSEPMQRVRGAWTFELPTVDLSSVPAERREPEMRRAVDADARRPFNLGTDLMLRATLYRLDSARHAVLVVMHHIASDGWSMAIFYRELGQCYRAFAAASRPILPTLPIQYGDFAEWQQQYLQGETLGRLADFWKGRMAGAPRLLDLPSDFPRPPIQSHAGGNVQAKVPPVLLSRLKQVASQHRVTLFMTLLAGFQIVVHRYTGQTDLVIGSPVAGRDTAETEDLIGFFINTLPLRTDLSGDPTVRELLARVRDVTLTAYEYREMPYDKLVEELQPERNLSFDPICQIYFMLQNVPSSPLEIDGVEVAIEPVFTGTSKADLTIWAIEQPDGIQMTAEYNADLYDAPRIERLIGHYFTVLEAMVADADRRISRIPLLTASEAEQELAGWNSTRLDYPRDATIHDLFARQAARTPDAPALAFEERELTYAELDALGNRLAARLTGLGAGPDVLIAICVERSIEMMVGLLGILKSGSAYVPLDPGYPKERLAVMLQDSRAPILVTSPKLTGRIPAHPAAVVCVEAKDFERAADGEAEPAPAEASGAGPRCASSNLAYVLYTSGSTGNPKGVMVTHRNVVNFFAGMDRALGSAPGVWLALTSISFDISVLELFWTLTRGFKVVLLSDTARLPGAGSAPRRSSKRPLDFSLFYFGSETREDDTDRYRLTLEGARFADRHGFKAVWTPERHFHVFGGLYPNPSLMSAAIAAVTERIEIRAGSVVLPLHHPLRVAEEWALVDNLSHGRAGIAVASGWHDRDFALAPANFTGRKEVLRRSVEILRTLWRGDAVEFAGGRGNAIPLCVFPRPIQRELPLWVTSAGSPETFRFAGEIGANLLTHFLGQEPEELGRKIRAYREARAAAGHSCPGCVTVALHTFLGGSLDEVRSIVHDPLCAYLRDSIELLRDLSQALYPGAEVKRLGEDEVRAVVEYSFERYFAACGLLGTPESCRRTLRELTGFGVDEVACLIDFGVDPELVLERLERLDDVRAGWQEGGSPQAGSRGGFSLPELVPHHGVTHVQCTPSFARLLLQHAESAAALGAVRMLLVGGEALPAGLAGELRRAVPAEIVNMYGPTETTIWSSTHPVNDEAPGGGAVPIGRPIANTRMYVLDPNRQPLPVGIPGELWIGGDGVARGYLKRPDLTGERFAEDPFAEPPGQAEAAGSRGVETGGDVPRMYRTGDLVKRRPDGALEFLGRVDFQVKVRGHRIELGEIEAALMRHSDVRQAVVTLRADGGDEPRLVAYVVPSGDGAPTPDALRDFLTQKLPEHMIPATYVTVESLPLTPNGKVDRKALPAPDTSGPGPAESFVAPAGELEQSLAAIWKDILRTDQIGVDDNFFDFGGHSLQVVQVQNRVREALRIDIPVLKLFQYPTIRALAKFIGEQGAVEPSVRHRSDERNRKRQAVIIPRRRPALVADRT